MGKQFAMLIFDTRLGGDHLASAMDDRGNGAQWPCLQGRRADDSYAEFRRRVGASGWQRALH